MKEFFHQATDLIYGTEDQGPESIKASLFACQTAFAETANALEKGEYDFDGTVEKEVKTLGGDGPGRFKWASTTQ